MLRRKGDPSALSILSVAVVASLLSFRLYYGNATSSATSVSYISQQLAKDIDAALMPRPGFDVLQLMELSGLAVAAAVVEQFPLKKYPKVVAVLGPGGNGGDGMVAARHLASMGYEVAAYYPKRNRAAPRGPHGYQRDEHLLAQAAMLGVAFITYLPSPSDDTVVLDAIFGFSFHGTPRPPFDAIIRDMNKHKHVVSVDVPSGWDVDNGPADDKALRPEVLVSLTLPKRCATAFDGAAHYLGKVFLPPKIADKHGLVRPAFVGAEQVVKL